MSDADNLSLDAKAPLSIEEIQNTVVESGFFKIKTEYLIIGDEPGESPGVFDLSSSLAQSDFESLKKYLTIMPRQLLFDFFIKKIWPSLPWDINNPAGPNDEYGKGGLVGLGTGYGPKTNADRIYGYSRFSKKAYEDLVWGAFIDLFNEANLEYCNKNKVEPWTWEQEKMDAYYVSSSKDSINSLAQDIEQYRDVALALDPKAKAIMEQFSSLPKLGDVGLEINRQNAIKELLKRKEYLTAQAIVDAYRYAQDTVIGEALTQPIPYDIVTDDGSVIARKS